MTPSLAPLQAALLAAWHVLHAGWVAVDASNTLSSLAATCTIAIGAALLRAVQRRRRTPTAPGPVPPRPAPQPGRRRRRRRRSRR